MLGTNIKKSSALLALFATVVFALLPDAEAFAYWGWRPYGWGWGGYRPWGYGYGGYNGYGWRRGGYWGRKLLQDEPAPTCTPLAEFVASRPDLTTINDILSFARVVTAKLDSASTELMADATPKTVLLPNDDGFASLEYWTNMTAYERAMKLLNETETTSFLGYHILSGGAFDSATVASLNGQTVDTCLSKTVMDTYPDSTVLDVGVEVRDPDVFIKARASEAKVVEADIPVCEGIVHVIDAPLLLCDTEMEFTDEEKTVVEAAVTKVAEMLEKYEEAMAPAPAPMEDETVMPMEAGAEEPQA